MARRTTLALAGCVAWLLVSVPTWLAASASPRFPVWIAVWVTGSAALVVGAVRARLDRIAIAALVVQSAAIAVMVGLLCNGFEGLLLVFIAAQLGRSAPLRIALGWVAVQTLVVAVVLGVHWTPTASLMLMAPYLGFQLFVLQLAEHSRASERVRIAHELHDVVGHHLTALSLNLEIAAHQTTEPARTSVRAAQSLARLLLGDIRELAYAMDRGQATSLLDGIARLADLVPVPAVHLDLPRELVIADPRRAHALLRCAQEFVTNSLKHAGARNIWITLTATTSQLELALRDDGAGTTELKPGGGLSAMRARLEELGGSLAIASPGSAGARSTPEGSADSIAAGDGGFALRAVVPA